MLDEEAVRQQLREVREEISQIAKRQEALLTVAQGLEMLLRLRNPKGASAQLPLEEDKPSGNGASTPKGRMSFRGAVLRVLKSARGQPLHAKEILQRAQGLGAITAAKDPIGITDLMCHSLSKKEPVAKVRPRTWRWTGP